MAMPDRAGRQPHRTACYRHLSEVEGRAHGPCPAATMRRGYLISGAPQHLVGGISGHNCAAQKRAQPFGGCPWPAWTGAGGGRRSWGSVTDILRRVVPFIYTTYTNFILTGADVGASLDPVEVLVTNMGRSPLWTSIRDTLTEEIRARALCPRRPPADRGATGRALRREPPHGAPRARRSPAEAGTVGCGAAARGRSFVGGTGPPPTRSAAPRQVSPEPAGRPAACRKKRILLLETRGAGAGEAAGLGLQDGAQVHVYEGLSLADGAPIALFRSVFPAARYPANAGGTGRQPVGDRGLRRAWAGRLHPRLDRDHGKARDADAGRATAPARRRSRLLRTVAVNVDAEGRPVEFGRTWFAGDRVALTLGAEGL